MGGRGFVESSAAPLDREPGEYLAMCDVPAPESGKSHAELGMVASSTSE